MDEAIDAFRTATELKPDFVEAYINLGALLFQEAKDDEAEKALVKALELKPDDPKIKQILGNINFEKAKALLQKDEFDQALDRLFVMMHHDPRVLSDDQSRCLLEIYLRQIRNTTESISRHLTCLAGCLASQSVWPIETAK